MYASTVTIVHKYIRQQLTQIAQLLGTMDPVDIDRVQGHLEQLVGMLKGHAKMEDQIFIPLVADINPAFARRMEDDHQALDAELDAIIARFKSLRLAHADDFELEQHQIYLNWNRFVADYLHHLDTEERDIFSLLPHSALNLDGLVANLQSMTGPEAQAFKDQLWSVTSSAEQAQIEAAMKLSAPRP